VPKKTAKTTKSPDKLAKTKKPASGVALTERELGQASGGAALKVKFDY
jgi:carbamoylphosphate synthase small subunit